MNDSTPIIDTHQHLIYPDRFNYAWTSGIPALAQKAFDVERYAIASAGCGIAKTMFMETAPEDWHGEAGFIETLAANASSSIAGIIANCRPEINEFERYIELLATRPFIVGVRRILHVEPDELSQQRTFVDNIRKLARHDLTFDLCVLQRQLPIGRTLVEACEDVQFILDHCGVPDIANGDFKSWQREISDIARLPNAACKISGLPTYAAPGQVNVQTLRPYVDHCLEAFGWDRVVWGSDWPVVDINADLKSWLDITREIVHGASPDQQENLFWKNASTIYGVHL